jgi:dimethylhistidine N-methyltransferase
VSGPPGEWPSESAPRSALPAPGLVADVRDGLSRSPKQLPAKYLYDELGSLLFEAICALPWYRVTRSEIALLAACASRIAHHVTGAPFIVELGPGNGDKLLRLAEAFGTRQRKPHLHLIDISSSALAAAEQALARLAGFTVTMAHATYDSGLAALGGVRPHGAPMLTLLLGSNVGNFDEDEAVAFLRRVRNAGRAGDWLLLGADLVKPERELVLAYDDPLGVTAAFNKNLLVRLNRELGAGFDVTQFDHQVVWNDRRARVEMHLVSRVPQSVALPGAGLVASFAAGESIWTESSCKYTPAGIASLGTAAGFGLRQQWLDTEAGFALSLFQSDRGEAA